MSQITKAHTGTQSKKAKHPLRRFLTILLILLLAYAGLIYFLVSASLISSFMQKLTIFDAIVERCYGEQADNEEIKQHLKNGQKPYKEWQERVETKDLTAETEEGYTLIGKEFLPMENRNPHVWVLLLHGYTGDKEAMYPYAFWYNGREDFHCIAPDMRCQGESEGDFIGMGWTDHYDSTVWIDYILSQDPEAEIILHGQSMGSSTALMMTGEKDLSPHVKAVVSDCAYTDAYSMFKDKAKAWLHIPKWLPIVESCNAMLQLRGGYDLKKASALEAVKKSSTPSLFIHGDQDAMIDYHMSIDLYDAATCEKELLIVEDAGHAQAQAQDTSRYWNTIFNFLHKYLETY